MRKGSFSSVKCYFAIKFGFNPFFIINVLKSKRFALCFGDATLYSGHDSSPKKSNGIPIFSTLEGEVDETIVKSTALPLQCPDAKLYNLPQIIDLLRFGDKTWLLWEYRKDLFPQ